MKPTDLRIKIFADTANLDDITAYKEAGLVKGFTTNPTLARKAGVTDYKEWGQRAATRAWPLPISIEILADDFGEMERQAHLIAGWGDNVYVKIPVTNTRGDSSLDLISRLCMPLNVTAVFTEDQIVGVANTVQGARSIVSVFAGRISDAGQRASTFVGMALNQVYDLTEVLWASPRQVFDIYEADLMGCDIITCTPALIDRFVECCGKDLAQYSLETVQMFDRDAKAAGFTL